MPSSQARWTLCALTIAAGAGYAQDTGTWSQWRGPRRDGWTAASVAPTHWPAALTKKWTVPVGQGYSSPVASATHVFVHSRGADAEEEVAAFELRTGAAAWRHRYPAPFEKSQYALRMDKGPYSTPLLAANRLYTLGATAMLLCLDSASGRVIWSKDFSSMVSTKKLFTGTAMSPVLEAGMIVVHVGDDSRAKLIALDAATGSERWSRDYDGPGYASPVAVGVDGVRQIVTLTDKRVIAVAPASGELLWSVPFPDEWNENIVTPVVDGGLVVVSGVRRGTVAIRPRRVGGRWEAKVEWENREAPLYMSCPLARTGKLIGFTSRNKGAFFSMDLATGKIAWSSEGRQAENAALVGAGSHILALTTEGSLLVAEVGAPRWQPLRKYAVSDRPAWAHPVVTSEGVVVKDSASITLWGGAK